MGWCYPVEWSTRTGFNCSYQLKPSNAAVTVWDTQVYAFLENNATALDEPVYTFGDLRGTVKVAGSASGIYTETNSPPGYDGYLFQSYARFVTAESDTLPFIIRYGDWNLSYIYRTGSVYLRYAEALNRLGKSTMAFAILKYGASNVVFDNPALVNAEEASPLPAYCNFPPAIFGTTLNTEVKGMHSRGSGRSERNAFYIIPAGVDTARFVDEKICEEMAMESAFEGNRFHDLMRFAKYYGNDFLANRVANRRGVEDAALKAKLMTEQNWYLPHN
jgi:hypothetical protein